MTITGGFPVRILASVKIRSRLGVRRADMQPVESSVSKTTASSPILFTWATLPAEKEVGNKSGLEIFRVLRAWASLLNIVLCAS